MGYLEEAHAFVRTLKQNPPNYESLSEALIDFKNGNMDTAALISRASELLHGHRDLIAGFNNFLPENYKLPVPSADESTENSVVDIPTQSRPQLSLKRKREVLNEAVKFVNKVRKFSKDDKVYTSFLRAVTEFQAHRDISRVSKEISGLFKDNPELYIEFTWFTADDVGVSTVPRKAKKKEVRKTFETCEDELYESDMLFHRVESTQKATEKLVNEMAEKGNGDGGIKVEDYYSFLNLKCIKMMYGEYGDEIIQLLETNPTKAALVVLGRLNIKLEDVRKLRETVRKHCAETMRNYHSETTQEKEEHNQH